ncbi:amidase [Limnohabitans sp. 2KL-51]|uniref:amidase n=1 Tax=Limnohabitans sp. 2KL-51 TaxID=1977911 RepID=UPI000D384556|nr:amidase [Limnohabitans sp. 2KL-51]PUE46532.1 amidase [Limnohabitans sp. 2KL-51]
MKADLIATRQAIQAGSTTVQAAAQACLAVAQSPACKHGFMQLTPDALQRTASHPQVGKSPLAGLAVSIKDLFDIQGQITQAGSIVLKNQPPAQTDCLAVARLRAAGAGLIGRTNMVEFAFSGIGTNPHHGTPAAWDGLYDQAVGGPGQPHAPGGSSSGAAVSVATGAAFIGLGSDTGGSIRVPAALNGIVGFKNTARLVPTQGALPLSTTLDTVCAMTRTVRDAILAHEVLSARHVPAGQRPLSGYRLAVVKSLMQDGMDATVSRAFEQSLNTLRAAGARIDEIALTELNGLAPMMSTGGFSPAEGFAWHREWLDRDSARYDPRVLQRLMRGSDMKAYEYMDLVEARRQWIRSVETELVGYDAVLSPTTPITGPKISDVAPGAERDAEFFRINGLLLRNTSVVNTLDGCGISLPCHAPGTLPVGLMAWHAAMHDDTILQLSLLLEPLLQKH